MCTFVGVFPQCVFSHKTLPFPVEESYAKYNWEYWNYSFCLIFDTHLWIIEKVSLSDSVHKFRKFKRRENYPRKKIRDTLPMSYSTFFSWIQICSSNLTFTFFLAERYLGFSKKNLIYNWKHVKHYPRARPPYPTCFTSGKNP